MDGSDDANPRGLGRCPEMLFWGMVECPVPRCADQSLLQGIPWCDKQIINIHDRASDGTLHWIPNPATFIAIDWHGIAYRPISTSPRPLAIPSLCVTGQPQVYVEGTLT